jgi:hypothetical protein
MSHIAYHIRRCTPADWDAWAVTTDLDGVEIPATEQDLLNRGVIVLHRDSAEVIYHFGRVGEDADAGYPGRPITPTSGPDVYLERRYAQLPLEARPKVYRARAYRSTDPTVILRESCEATVAAQLGARVPATGRTSARPADPLGAMDVLEEARRRANPPENPDGTPQPPTARALTVPMAEVEDGDVVEADMLIPVRMAGEPDR